MSSPPSAHPSWLIRVDTGGTFTDGWAQSPEGRQVRCKVLSSGILRTQIVRRIDECGFELRSGLGAPEGVLCGFEVQGGTCSALVVGWDPKHRLLRVDQPCPWAVGELLEFSTGEEAPIVAARLMTGIAPADSFPKLDFRLATTRGTNALLERRGAEGVLLITEGFEDLLRVRDQRREDLFALDQSLPPPVFERSIGVVERVDADGSISKSLNEEQVRAEIAKLRESGVAVVAVALLNSYANPEHEVRIGELLREAGIEHYSLSHELTQRVRLLPRAETVAANAYLAPIMTRFVESVQSRLTGGTLELLTSAGYLKSADHYEPIDSLLSGPAGGVVGALVSAQRARRNRILAFDMGGTSTDVARLEGAPSLRYEQEIGPVRVVAPAIEIETVAAGGGSICQWRRGGLEVGPESAGADPGPACYGRGGPLTITDVNLLLDYMEAGKAGIPLDRTAAQQRFEELKETIVSEGGTPGSDRELLEGMREIAVERMAEAINRVSLREGYDPSEYTLVAFGGAGPQHACAVADKLGIREILIPGDAGLLSAWGLHRSVREHLVEQQLLTTWSDLTAEAWETLRAAMEDEVVTALGKVAVIKRRLFELRLLGQDSGIEISSTEHWPLEKLRSQFEERYRALYGYDVPEGRAVELVAVRLIGAELGEEQDWEEFSLGEEILSRPRVMQDSFRTCLVEPGWAVCDGSAGSLWLARGEGQQKAKGWSAEVEAELYRCRFENVVEEMGELLRRTAISTNVKERLDYSCALMDAEGKLVVNAPHIPVHLGALGECVRQVSKGRTWRQGDMVVVNHPGMGGSHLPDVTVVSPVMVDGEVIAYVANRAHHAEIGGRTPGSMPAQATSLAEEGVVLSPQLLFSEGKDRFPEVKEVFEGAAYPSRMLEDNLADLAAQAAANRHGVAAVLGLVEGATVGVLHRNMDRLSQRAAEVMAERISQMEDGVSWTAEDALDDGTAICVKVSKREDGFLLIDFSDSGAEHGGNLNATPSIVRSAVLYCLRALVAEDIPLNEGLLDRVEIRTPPGILNPSFPEDLTKCPAVVGGNVETSQRVVDVLLEALGLQAHGQGTMNNFLFGTDRFGYYETIGGGSGAGPGWPGMSGTHVHMSNTAITDPEILERRFPVQLRRFGLRPGSGGRGCWNGGDGLVREVEFQERMTVSFLTQRRRRSPSGGAGGEGGNPGRQLLVRSGQEPEALPEICSLEVQPGDRIVIETPGGGGWGEKLESEDAPCFD